MDAVLSQLLQLVSAEQGAAPSDSDYHGDSLSSRLCGAPQTLDDAHDLLLCAASGFSAYVDGWRLKNRATRNESSPAYCLPPEIYIQIFECIRYSPTFNIEDAVAVSHVSRTWRAIALDAPFLWALIRPARADLIKACAARSKVTPLEISFWGKHGSPLKRERLYGAVLPSILHGPCLGTFSMNHICPTDLVICLPPSAPQLRTLALSVTGRKPADTRYSVTPETFHSSLPSLRELSLSGMLLPLCYFSGLEKLRLRYVLFTAPILFRLIRALGDCPSLEQLHFVWESFALPDAEIEGELRNFDSPIRLPCLRDLKIKGSTSAVVRAILGLVRAPSVIRSQVSAKLDFGEHLRHIFPSDMDVKDIFPGLSSLEHLEVIGVLLPGQALTLRGQLGASTQSWKFTLYPPSASPYSASFAWCDTLRYLRSSRSPFPALTALTLRDLKIQHFRLPIEFANALKKMHSIQHIAFHSCSPALVETLTIKINRRLFLNLKSLRLDQVDISKPRLLDLIKSRMKFDDGARVSVWAAVDLAKFALKNSREEAWATLDALRVTKCAAVDLSTAIMCKGLMRDVRWNGRRSFHAP
ncbi:hypothetical protein BOTBODRAFT_178320 [Botryobasidium botryosum FD-172 SS1]|uniref:F-box domain-containing protein n=1 Tax=Botryobasidium botryosum (strain FD-172 SS1) TaxID=930990 RepID=A0A067M425_BOTB1|nr:hypothetical protein BOTBODRAFT_178320 [Botryobasidium botryosum FD-172 SS1]